MRLNDDLCAPALVHAADLPWTPSPAAGVERRMLFRIGEEKARATSIVRYAPGSRFDRHVHSGGEEFLVLAGVFQDETDDFPAGTYVRNPPGSAHAPGSAAGCTLFVKLWQFSAADRERVVVRPDPLRPAALRSRLLFEGFGERVTLEDWAPGAEVERENREGLELLVLSGGFACEAGRLERWSWLRLPPGRRLVAQAGVDGARVWCKAAPPLLPDVCPFDGAVPSPAS